uniref:Uncharacterized mitochondrial protein AtMg00810-like n=1 Tax=Tanacetum cinerariifolium TaxID=118510 RepID=A0A6L2P516_TANCI|nr:uncharacterized mitochondrial protein AtMg00810-like [Tanacetum cinerariifolium]
MSGTIHHILPPLETNTGSPSNPNVNKVNMMPNIDTTNTSPTINIFQSVIDDDLLLPQLLGSKGGSHIINVLTFDKDDFTSWKIRFSVFLDGLEPYLIKTLEDGPFVPMSNLSAPANQLPKRQNQWSNAESHLDNQDKRLKSIIIGCLTNDVMKSVIKYKIAKEMWTEFCLAYEGPSDTKDTKIGVLRLKFNAFKALEGEKFNGTYSRLKCLLNDFKNNGVIISQSKVNATFVNILPRKWLSMNQTQRANNSIKNDSLAALYGKYHYEEGLIDDVEEDNRTSNEFMADLNVEYHERALLANQKRFYKRSGRVGSARKPVDKSKKTCFACGKPSHFQKNCPSNKTSTPSYLSSNVSLNKPKPYTPSFTPNIPQNSSIHQKDYKGKYKGLKAKMVVLSQRIDELTKGKNDKGNGDKGKSDKGLVAESFDWDDESVSSEDKRTTKFKAFMAIAEDEPSRNNLVNKFNGLKQDLALHKSKLSLGGKGRRKENNSKEVPFTKVDVSTSEPVPMITSDSKDDSDNQVPLPPLPKLTGAEPSGTSKSLISLSGLTANMANLTLNIASKRIKNSSDKVSQAYVIKKKTEPKHSAVQNSCPDKNALPSTEQLLLTLMKEVKDSVCSRYMTGVKQYLHRYSKESGLKVVFKDNSSGDTKGYGSANYNGITFIKVAYVNGLKQYLISISKLCDANFKVLFIMTQGTIFNEKDKVVLIASRRRGVYVIDMSSYNTDSNACFYVKASLSFNWLWHTRLSHLNFKTINNLLKYNLVSGLPSLTFSKDKKCSACEKGKHHRATFKTKRQMENLNDTKVKQLRSDNGTEFRNHTLEAFCDEKDISQNFSSPCTSEQNGVAERRNKTLIEVTRTMLNSGSLPKQFWGEAVNEIKNGRNFDVTFSEDDETILQTSTEGDAINFIEVDSFPDEEFSEPRTSDTLCIANTEYFPYVPTFDRLSIINHLSPEPIITSSPMISSTSEDSSIPNIEDVVLALDEAVHPELAATFESTNLQKDDRDEPINDHPLLQVNSPLADSISGPHVPQDRWSREKHIELVNIIGKPLAGPGESGVSVNKTQFKGMIRYQANPKESHLVSMKRIFRYLKGTPNLGLWYPKGSGFNLKAYSDSDYVSCNHDRKSTSGGCQILEGKLVCWSAKKQIFVAMSSAEAEYVVVARCCAQVLWIKSQLADYDVLYDKGEHSKVKENAAIPDTSQGEHKSDNANISSANEETTLVIHQTANLKTNKDGTDYDELDKDPMSKKFKIMTLIPDFPTPTPLCSIHPKHMMKPAPQEESVQEFTHKLFQTTSLSFSLAPLKEPSPPRDPAKGKGVDIEELVNVLVPFME